MISQPIRPFIDGTHYRRLQGDETRGGTYRFLLLKPTTLQFATVLTVDNRTLSFRDADKQEWLRISPHSIQVAKNYAWNGNSPKRGIGGFWFGTPDFEATRFASVVHDALYQFSGSTVFPLSHLFADQIYRELCQASGFALSGLYYAALRACSGPAWGKRLTDGEHCIIL